MSEPIFKPGDRVRVSDAWREEHPESPLPGRVLIVGRPGQHAQSGEVPITYSGTTWYVPAAFVSHAEAP